MSALRFLYLVALTVWAGGLFVLGGVAGPALFESLPARAPEMGTALASAALASTLARFHAVALACGGVMLVSLVGMALIGPRPRPYALRLGVIAAMLACTATATLPVQRQFWRVHAAVGPIVQLPAGDPQATESNGLSSGLLAATGVGALALLFWESRERRG